MISLKPGISPELFTFYQSAYDFGYQNCLGKTIRTKHDWLFLSERLKYLSNTKFFNLTLPSGQTIGYLIQEGSTVMELAAISGFSSYDILYSVKVLEELPKIRIPFSHQLLKNHQIDEITYSSRTCTYGGHMVRCLKGDASTATDTANLLKVQIEGYSPTDYPKFNLSFCDIL